MMKTRVLYVSSPDTTYSFPTSRRTRSSERVSMARLRQDVYDAIGAFDGMLTYGQTFVDRAPHPVHYQQGSFLPAPGL